MGTASKIFTALSAGAPCLLAYPGIFSGLSNDGKQSPALIFFILHAFHKYRCVGNFAIFENTSATKAFHEEPTLSMPFQGVDFCFHPTFTVL